MFVEQRTDEWLADRVGRITASRFKAVLARLKNGQPAQARNDYLMDVVCERLTGQPTHHFVNQAMQWGIDQEEFAREAYEQRTRVVVEKAGFIILDGIKASAGASPDGLVGVGCIEIKAPNTRTHVQTILDGMPDEHYAQLQGVMWVAGREWCDFISWDPRVPGEYQLFVQRIERDEPFIEMLKREIEVFDQEVEATIRQIEESKQ
jgi:hypothetical protein